MQLLFHFHNKKSKLFLRELGETLQGRFFLKWKGEKYLIGELMKTQVFVAQGAGRSFDFQKN